MKQGIKKWISLVIFFSMIISCCITHVETAYADTTEFFVDANGVLKSYNGLGGDVIIPSNVRTIGRKAFCGNRNITSITIPSSVKIIEESAFDSCTMLRKVVAKKGLEKIGDSAFWGCTSLVEVFLPQSLKEIGYGAFCQCDELNGMVIPSSVQTIGIYSLGYLYLDMTYTRTEDYLIVAGTGTAAEKYAKDNSFAILDKKDLQSKVTKVKSTAKKKATVTYQKANVDGYQIQYSTDSKFSKAKTKTETIRDVDRNSRTITGLKTGKKYYVRVCGYKKVAGTIVLGKWSKKVSVTVQ